MASPAADFVMSSPALYVSTIRPVAIAVVLSVGLWGIGLAQVYHCFKILSSNSQVHFPSSRYQTMLSRLFSSRPRSWSFANSLLFYSSASRTV
ncbi:hypothetical protein BT69DRAFT_590509 [Atractiella rhizophila]|nr:hypothetical protein BT69DRAFT_590509 [Atractiella rhizophila]